MHRLTFLGEDGVFLNRVLNFPNLQKTVKVLTLKNRSWSGTRALLPNRMKFRLTRLDLDNVRMNEPNLIRDFEGCGVF